MQGFSQEFAFVYGLLVQHVSVEDSRVEDKSSFCGLKLKM